MCIVKMEFMIMNAHACVYSNLWCMKSNAHGQDSAHYQEYHVV